MTSVAVAENNLSTQISQAPHVGRHERAIQRVKEFNILDNIEHHQRQLANRIFQVAVSLVNLQAPIIAKTPRNK